MSSPIFWNILPHVIVLEVCSLLFRSFWNWAISFGFIYLFPRPLMCSGIVYDSYHRLIWWATLRPLARYVLRGRFAAFWPVYIIRIFIGNFTWKFRFGKLILLAGPLCGLRPTSTWWAALRPSAAITWLAALRPFGPYVIKFSFWDFTWKFSYWELSLLNGTLWYILPTGSGWAASRPSAHSSFVGLLVSFDLIMDWLALLWLDWPWLRLWPFYLVGRFSKCLVRPLCGLWPYYGLLRLCILILPQYYVVLGVIGLHCCSTVMTLPRPLSGNILLPFVACWAALRPLAENTWWWAAPRPFASWPSRRDCHVYARDFAACLAGLHVLSTSLCCTLPVRLPSALVDG